MACLNDLLMACTPRCWLTQCSVPRGALLNQPLTPHLRFRPCSRVPSRSPTNMAPRLSAGGVSLDGFPVRLHLSSGCWYSQAVSAAPPFAMFPVWGASGSLAVSGFSLPRLRCFSLFSPPMERTLRITGSHVNWLNDKFISLSAKSLIIG